MAEFYNSIGTIVCYSESEGTPNPVLEAAMCGRPVISSYVGNVPELMKNIESFKPVRSFSELVNSIKRYKNNLDLNKIGINIEAEAKEKWNWAARSSLFVELLEG
jgi:glycosyltransferase involved in cell wall biosynthesis